jgi:hypothetical protein
MPAPRRRPRHPVRALVLTPTRELAAGPKLRDTAGTCHCAARSFGGVDMNAQIEQLQRGRDPRRNAGRLLDHVQTRRSCQPVPIFTDEADPVDRFLPDIKRIIAALTVQRQNLLFSATFPDEIRNLVRTCCATPRRCRWRPAMPLPSSSPHVRGRAREKKREASRLPHPDAPAESAGIHRHASGPTASPASCGATISRRCDPRRQAQAGARRRSRPGPARPRCSSPPTLRRAAWTRGLPR